MKKFFCKFLGLLVIALALQIFSVQCEATRHFIIDTDTGGDDEAALLLAARNFELFSVFGKDGMGDADLIHPQS